MPGRALYQASLGRFAVQEIQNRGEYLRVIHTLSLPYGSMRRRRSADDLVTHAVIIFVDEIVIVAVFTFFAVRVFKISAPSVVFHVKFFSQFISCST